MSDPDTGSDEVLDETARAAFNRRPDENESELDSVDANRARALALERSALIAELAWAFGLGGRAR